MGESASTTKESSGIGWKRIVVSIVLAPIVGGLAAWATAEIGISLLAFVAITAVSGYHMYSKPIATKSLAIGLYWAAILGLLVPFLFYIPGVFDSGTGMEGAEKFAGSLLGIIVWGVVFGIGALVTFVVGYFVNKRAEKKLDTAG